MSGTKQHFIAMDGLRGVAALLVVEYHAVTMFFGDRHASNYLAVDLFFAISGFVLAYAYEAKLVSGLSMIRFMTVRTLRLYPLYLLGLALGLSYAVAVRLLGNAPFTWQSIAASLVLSLAFLPTPPDLSLDGRSMFPLNYPVWSLFFELIANLLYALIARMLSNTILVVIVVISALALVMTASAYGSLAVGHEWSNFPGGFARVGFSFFAGVLIFRVHPQLRFRFAGSSALCVLVLLATVSTPIAPAHRLAFDIIAVLLVFPMLLIAAAHARTGRATGRVFVMLGSASYAIYVIHAPIIMWINAVMTRLPSLDMERAAPWAGAAMLVLLVALGVALDTHFDGPIRKVLTNQLRCARGKLAG